MRTETARVGVTNLAWDTSHCSLRFARPGERNFEDFNLGAGAPRTPARGGGGRKKRSQARAEMERFCAGIAPGGGHRARARPRWRRTKEAKSGQGRDGAVLRWHRARRRTSSEGPPAVAEDERSKAKP